MWSGIAGVIKAALMLERGFLLPNYDFKQPNPKIPWKEWCMKVPVTQRPWPRGKKYISVNNFGFGGTNGHIVLEAAPFRGQKVLTPGEETPERVAGQGRKLYVMTANDKNALAEVMKNVVIYLEQRPEIFQMDLTSNLAYTLGQRRSLLQYRAAVPAANSFELIEAINGDKFTPGKEVEPLRLGFIFTGQGAQWFAMGRELYEQYPVFTDSIERANRCMAALGAGWSLVTELSRDAKSSRVSEAHISQPSCTAIQLALVDLLRTWSIRPVAVAGHSSGEIAAAYAAGIIDFASAVAIAYHRGRLIPILKETHPGLQGRMMAVGGSKEDVEPLIDGLTEKQVRIACFNSPSSLTISGDEPALAELEKVVEEKQMFNRRLQVDVAYHSHHMNLVAKEYRSSIANLQAPVPTDIRFHSSLHGRLVDGTELQPGYWVDNLTCPVRFSEAVQSMLEPVGEHKHGVNMIVELGPHSALQGPVKQILKVVGGTAVKLPYASALIRKRDAVETAMELAATLFTKGANLDFSAINFPKPATTKPPVLLTDLPRYPWNYSARYWQESRMTLKHKQRAAPRSDILGTLANYSNDLEPTWRNIVRLDDLPWLQHHKIQGLTVFPMAGFVAMALEAASQRATGRDLVADRFELKDVSIVKPLVIPEKDTEMTITLRPHQDGTLAAPDGWDEFRICSWSHDQGWTEHCVGLVVTKTLVDAQGEEMMGDRASSASAHLIQKVKEASRNGADVTSPVTPALMYDSLVELGVAYGATFQGVESCQAADTFSMGQIAARDIAKEMPNGFLTDAVVQPAFIESLIAMYWPVLGAGRRAIDTIYLPSSIDHMIVSSQAASLTKEPGSSLQAYCSGEVASAMPTPTKMSMAAVTSGDELGQVILAIQGLTISPILDGETQVDSQAPRELCYKQEWEPIFPELVLGQDAGSTVEGSALASIQIDEGIVIIHEDSNAQHLIALGLANTLEAATGKLPEVGSLETVDASGKICVFISELHRPFLAHLSPERFSALQAVLTTAHGVLWVVRGAYAGSTNPEANMITGLSRSIRSETAMKFATLDLDGVEPLTEADTVRAVANIFGSVFTPSGGAGELEFMERKGAFSTPRIVLDTDTDTYVHKQTNPSALEPTAFGEDGRALRMEITLPAGGLDTLHFVDDGALETPLAAGDVEMEVRAIGLGTPDVHAALSKGVIPLSTTGSEASGVVVAIGPDVSGLQVGDRVACLTKGAFATRVRADAAKVFKLSPEMSFAEGAALPLAYCTAYYALVEVARLAEGDTLLIHAAGSPVGQAAIAVARMVGAEVFAAVSSPEENALVQKCGVKTANLLSRHNPLVALQHATAGRGVDVVLHSISPDGNALRESWSCLARFGRLVHVNPVDGSKPARLEVGVDGKNATYAAVDVLGLAEERPKTMARLVSDVAGLVRYAKTRPVLPIVEFSMAEVAEALKTVQSAKTLGKVVVIPGNRDIVKVCYVGDVSSSRGPERLVLLRAED
jgi:acyl transferase domain-containing protein/NADPH:quinone reductase-like Zn-dependent oxidoreductase